MVASKAESQLPVLGSTAEVAAFLRCSEPLVRRLIRANKLHAVTVGRSLRIPRSSVERFLPVEDVAS
jgi:excisionase family DNA binding protein